MALTITSRAVAGNSGAEGQGQTRTTTSFTPASDSKLYVVVGAIDNPARKAFVIAQR